jgi:hypothetical protein
MSYQGFGVLGYDSLETVDEEATHTSMMGAESVANQRSMVPSWRNDATKSLLMLWVFVLLVYWLTGFFFRRYLV